MFPGGLSKMMDMMKQVQKMQSGLKKAQEELSSYETEAVSAGGNVKIKINGQMEIKSVKIAPQALGDASKLEKDILIAANSAISKAKEAAASKLGDLSGGIDIPGLPKVEGSG